ncbi:MAG: L-threonylcarbamoyladenylate synthase [Dehalococcoidia bacterium]
MPVLGPDRIGDVIEALRSGEVVAIPTDTVYGLAAMPDDPTAVRRLAELKGRAAEQPVQLLVSGIEVLESHIEDTTALETVRPFWPGALTAVVRTRPGFASEVVTPAGTVGVRQPADDLALTLIEGCGGALAATSANRHDEPPATSVEEVIETFGEDLLVLDGGPRDGGVASTVVDLTVAPPRILRAGPITEEMLGIEEDSDA